MHSSNSARVAGFTKLEIIGHNLITTLVYPRCKIILFDTRGTNYLFLTSKPGVGHRGGWTPGSKTRMRSVVGRNRLRIQHRYQRHMEKRIGPLPRGSVNQEFCPHEQDISYPKYLCLSTASHLRFDTQPQ